MISIPFNKPYLHGRELVYIAQSVASGKISGDGIFTKKCHSFFEEKYGIKKALLTTSCTDALEMCALLLNIQKDDEVILPAFTFVSTANAFALRGAKLVFADSCADSPNIDPEEIKRLITPKTKVIVVVHYAGIACDMDAITAIAKQYDIPIIEDAAQSIDSFHNGRPLGTLGCLGAFSFHETKNVISGEGGMLSINDPKFIGRAEIIREKGTNRSSFFRGEVDKYGWVELGSSFLPSDIIAAYLYAQLEVLNEIQNKRRRIWNQYDIAMKSIEAEIGQITTPFIPIWATNNAHMYYITCASIEQRTKLIEYLKTKKIQAVFHYLSLHSSAYFIEHNDGRPLLNSDKYSDRLLRLPLYFEMTDEQVELVIETIGSFFRS
jgi:dTDP-4-amino-4,6-dideoxygalactose transaminase